MPYRKDIVRRTERYIVAKTFVDMAREIRASLFDKQADGRKNKKPNDTAGVGTLCMVACGVMVGTAEGKPMTASKLSLYLDLPRTTILRKLDQLISMGVVERRPGATFVIAADRAKNLTNGHIDRLTR